MHGNACDSIRNQKADVADRKRLLLSVGILEDLNARFTGKIISEDIIAMVMRYEGREMYPWGSSEVIDNVEARANALVLAIRQIPNHTRSLYYSY